MHKKRGPKPSCLPFYRRDSLFASTVFRHFTLAATLKGPASSMPLIMRSKNCAAKYPRS